MKRIAVRILIGFGALFVIGAFAAAIFVWRLKSSLAERKPAVVTFANKFAGCFYSAERSCLEAMTIWEPTTIDTALVGAATFRNRLGVRGSATPVDESWRMNEFAGTKSGSRPGVTTTIRVAFSVAYERDTKAHELFEIVDDGNGLRVKSFHVDSPVALGLPAANPDSRNSAPAGDGSESL